MSNWSWLEAPLRTIEDKGKQILSTKTPDEVARIRQDVEEQLKREEDNRKKNALEAYNKSTRERINAGYSQIGNPPTYYKAGIPYVSGFWNPADPTSVLTREGFNEQKGSNGKVQYTERNSRELKSASTYEEYLRNWETYNTEVQTNPGWEADRMRVLDKEYKIKNELEHTFFTDWSRETQLYAIEQFKKAHPLTDEQLYRLLLKNVGEPWISLNQWDAECPPNPSADDSRIDYFYKFQTPLRGYAIQFWWPSVDQSQFSLIQKARWFASVDSSLINPAAGFIKSRVFLCRAEQTVDDNYYSIIFVGVALLFSIVVGSVGTLISSIRR